MSLKTLLPYILLLGLGSVFLIITSISNNKVVFQKETGKVLRIVDGDTIKVFLDGQEETVRLIGIDSPEIVDEGKPIQCFGKESLDKVKELLNGKSVILEKDESQSDRDDYGRLLRYVFVNKANVGNLLIREGYVYEYSFKGKNYKYKSEFISSEKRAKEENKGLWDKCRN